MGKARSLQTTPTKKQIWRAGYEARLIKKWGGGKKGLKALNRSKNYGRKVTAKTNEYMKLKQRAWRAKKKKEAEELAAAEASGAAQAGALECGWLEWQGSFIIKHGSRRDQERVTALAYDCRVMLADLPEDLADEETGPFMIQMEKDMKKIGQLSELAPYTVALMHSKFKKGRSNMRRRCVVGDIRRRNCDCPTRSKCKCNFAPGTGAFPSRRHLQLTLHSENYFRLGWASPPERQPAQVAKMHGEGPVASLFGCPCPRMEKTGAAKQLTDENMAEADVEAVLSAAKCIDEGDEEVMAWLRSTATHEKLRAVSLDISLLFAAAGSSMTVEAYVARFGYLIGIFHDLNVATKHSKNPHWIAETYGSPWLLSRLAYLLKIRLRTTRATTWPWFWEHVGILKKDDSGLVEAAQASLQRAFPSGPRSFFVKFGLHGVFDPVLLSVCICSHKKRSVTVVGGCGADGYAWDGK